MKKKTIIIISSSILFLVIAIVGILILLRNNEIRAKDDMKSECMANAVFKATQYSLENKDISDSELKYRYEFDYYLCLLNKGVKESDLSKWKLEDTTSIDDYEKYIASIDSICPFNGTAKTTECLDKEIANQKQVYESLSKEILKTAQKIKESSDKAPVEVTIILSSLPKYNETREGYIENICSLRNAPESGGTAIIEDSRKCALYYDSIDIEILKNIKEFLIAIQK